MSEKSAHRQRFKEAHAAKLRDGILEMRYNEEITDFKVIVGSVVFKVHRLVMAASSPYFKAMLSHNMKETIDGEVVMKEVTPGAIKACIEFMYSGEADLSAAEISDVLYAAAFMQLDLFLEFCRDYLEEHLGINTALHARRLACAYGFDNVELESTKFIEGNIKDISSTEQFLSLSVDEIAEFIKILDADKGTIWLGVINWIRHDAIERTKHLARLLRLYSESNINLESFILSSWCEEEVKHSKQCRQIIQERLVTLTPDELALISTTICCQLKQILHHCELGDVAAINGILNEILISNFVEISRKSEFESLLYGDVAAAIQKSKCTEEVKWEAILKWTKGGKQRKNRFPGLFRLLNFDAIPLDFIQGNVRNEILVRESSESMAILMDVFAAKVQNTRHESDKGDEALAEEDREETHLVEENSIEQSFASVSNEANLTSTNRANFQDLNNSETSALERSGHSDVEVTEPTEKTDSVGRLFDCVVTEGIEEKYDDICSRDDYGPPFPSATYPHEELADADHEWNHHFMHGYPHPHRPPHFRHPPPPFHHRPPHHMRHPPPPHHIRHPPPGHRHPLRHAFQDDALLCAQMLHRSRLARRSNHRGRPR